MIPFTESKLAVIHEQALRSQEVGHLTSLLWFTPERFLCGAAVFTGSLVITGGGGWRETGREGGKTEVVRLCVCARACVCECVWCVCVCMLVHVHVCVCACVRACVHVCVLWMWGRVRDKHILPCNVWLN